MEWEKTGSEGFYKKMLRGGLLSGHGICHVESYMAVIILKLAVCSRDNYCTQFGVHGDGPESETCRVAKAVVVFFFFFNLNKLIG